MGRRRSFFLVPTLLALGACATQPDIDELTAGPVVATKFDPNLDFGSFDTFAVNPTVSVVRDVGDGGTISSETAAAITDRITSNMSARGYQLVTLSERPSLGMQATVFLQLRQATTSFGGAWWGSSAYGGVPAYWGYPTSAYFAPWSYSTTTFKTGTLVIECVDLRDAGPMNFDAAVTPLDAATGRLEIAWTAYAHGIAQSVLSSLTAEALVAIDQAFAQSPYLQRTGTAP